MAGAMYRLPFEDDDEWSVAQSSWDDSSGASHGNSQAYAIDFGHDNGGKVRAARGGIVATMKSTNTVNTDDLPDNDPRKNDPNFTAGNWVLIRHIDGTVASYDHLKTGEVFVNTGDVVSQGQLIAHSNNTGASSGPHLHFHVRSFWNTDNDKGPTIPVFFEDKKHTSFRPMKGASLASNNAYLRQEDWRHCIKCQGLFLGGRSSRCPKSGEHAASDQASNFILQENTGKAYFFKDDRYNRYDVAADGVEPGFPATISKFWPGVWDDDIDAAVVWNNSKAYFFKGDQYIRYDIAADRADHGFPAKISKFWKGLWEDDIDAAVMWNNGKAYFFKGDQYIRYDVAADRADHGFPVKISKFWKGLWEDDIDAAVMWDNGKAYFFKGDQYIRYDVVADRADHGFPASIEKFWSGLEGDIDASILWPDVGQHEWRRCSKCAGLFSKARGNSHCPADGPHAQAGRVEYSLTASSSGDWHACHKCAGLFFGNGTDSTCPAGQKHDATGQPLTLSSNVTEVAQDEWSQCSQCLGLFFSGASSSSCPSGGKHKASGSGFVVMMNSPNAPGQHDWRRCSKCAVMFFGGSSKSVCPKGSGHRQTANANFSLVINAPGAPGQHGWRQCAKCSALFLGGGPGSKCPVSGQHSAGNVDISVMPHAD